MIMAAPLAAIVAIAMFFGITHDVDAAKQQDGRSHVVEMQKSTETNVGSGQQAIMYGMFAAEFIEVM